MRKFIVFLMLALVMLASCEKNKKEEIKQEEQTTVVESLDVENIISTDREFMFLNYGDDYRWYETCILMKDFMDEEPTSDVIMVNSIFQVVTERGKGYDVHVIKISHQLDTSYVEVVKGLWVEDFSMNDEEIIVTYEEAWNKAMEANCPKPHSQHCVLRKEVGPKAANPQYIFGNSRCQIYVDANTGEATPVNPVILNGPLGEWP